MLPHSPYTSRIIIAIILLILTSSSIWTFRYLALFQNNRLNSDQITTVLSNPITPTPTAHTNYQIIEVATNLDVPWAIAFTSPDRMLVSERAGSLRELNYRNNQWQLQPKPLITFTEVSTNSEEGLMGLTQDPDYQNNHYLYACLAYPKNNSIVDKVIRFIDPISMNVNNPDPTQEILLDNIPAAQYHAGCELKFGPDQKLYITTGDATDKQIAQDLQSLGGKILRLNSDGSIPTDNPFPNSPIYSYGHRNPQGIDFHPTTGQLWSTEHGPSIFDGPAGGDEINLIIAGNNYGWPLVSHQSKKDGTIDPKLLFTPAIAPGSLIIYTGEIFPQWRHNLLFTALKGEGIIHATIDQETISTYQLLDLQGLQPRRIREIIQAPDQTIYFTTSNRDGRGTLRPSDDKIYQILPQI